MPVRFAYRVVLLVASIGLCPIALSYGLAPQSIVADLFGFSADAVNAAHIFRALMGLYFGMILLWLMGFFIPRFTSAALLSLIIFMLGLVAGRLLSFFLDGLPTSPLLITYLVLEIVAGFLGILSYRKVIISSSYKS